MDKLSSNITNSSLDENIIRIMEADLEHRQCIQEIKSSFRSFRKIKESILRLTTLRDSIKKDGVNTQLMEVVDPFNELVNAGISPSYENLGEESSDAIVCNLSNTLNIAHINKRTSLEGIVDKIKSFFIKAKEKEKTIDDDLEKAIHEFSLIKSFDEKAFATTEVTMAPKQYFDRKIACVDKFGPIIASNVLESAARKLIQLVRSKSPSIKQQTDEVLRKLGSHFKAAASNKDLNNLFGIKISIDKDGRFVMADRCKQLPIKEKKSIGALGWKISDLKGAIEKAKHADKIGDDIIGHLNEDLVYAWEDEIKLELLNIVEDMENPTDAKDTIRRIDDLIDSMYCLYYYQSAFEEVLYLLWDVHRLLVIAIKCQKHE